MQKLWAEEEIRQPNGSCSDVLSEPLTLIVRLSMAALILFASSHRLRICIVVMFLVLDYGATFACPAMPTSVRPANQQTPSFFTLLRGRASPLLLRRLGRAWLPSRAGKAVKLFISSKQISPPTTSKSAPAIHNLRISTPRKVLAMKPSASIGITPGTDFAATVT